MLKCKEQDKVIYSHIRRKWLIKTPEEIVRQNYLIELVNTYGYSIDQMDEEIEVTGLASGGARADFVIWKTAEDKARKKSPFIIVECKAENISMKEDTFMQGELYARQTNAPFFVTHNSRHTKFWRVKKDRLPGYREEIEDIPKSNATESEIKKIIDKLKVFKEDEFAELLHSCHNIIRNREKLDPAAAFDEIAKVLFMKVYAERHLTRDIKGNIFTLDYIEEAEKYAHNYIDKTFEDTKKEFGKDKIFASDERINLKNNTIKSIIQKLEKYNLSATSTDVKGIAFERFLGKTFRGEIGQFFTPRNIVEFMVDFINPKEGEVVCDPASGSGGFLIRYFETVQDEIAASIDKEYILFKEQLNQNDELSLDEKNDTILKKFRALQSEMDQTNKNSRMWTLANRCIYGVDANDRMARTSKMNMIMHGDGHGGIHHHDGFINVNGVFENRFDVILTNPPFGQSVEKDDVIQKTQIELDEEIVEYYEKIYGDNYIKSQDRVNEKIGKSITKLFKLPKGDSIKTELLFVERCLELLKPNGRMGIVLPEGVFNNTSLEYVRSFVESRGKIDAIISLPLDTFTSSGARVKASILFVRKYSEAEKETYDNLIQRIGIETEKKYESRVQEVTELIRNKSLDKAESYILRQKKKALNEELQREIRSKIKKSFNYKVFFAEASYVGMNNGTETCINELPLILKKYNLYKSENSLSVEKKCYEGIEKPIYYADFMSMNKWIVPPKLLLNYANKKKWPFVPVSQLVNLIDERQVVEKTKYYKMVGVKWYGEGAFYRETVKGNELSAKYLHPLQKDAFIYNRLFAWKTSFAIVPDELLGCYVSNEFPQFVVNENIVLKEFLYFIFTQEFMIEIVSLLSAGSSAVSRNRFREEDFLSIEIPLPPIEEQRVVVDDFNSTLAEYREMVALAEKLKNNAVKKVKDCIVQ